MPNTFEPPPQFDTRPEYMQQQATAIGPVSKAGAAAGLPRKKTFGERLLEAIRGQGQAGLLPSNGSPLGPAAESSAFTNLGMLGGRLAKLAFMAEGGVRRPGQPAMMGEAGPELIVNGDGTQEVVGAASGPRLVIPLSRPPEVPAAGDWNRWELGANATPPRQMPLPSPRVAPAAPDIPAPQLGKDEFGEERPGVGAMPAIPTSLMRNPLPEAPNYPTNARDAYAKAMQDMPAMRNPGILNRLGAAALGAGAGWVNASGRSHIPWQQVSEAQHGILQPGYDRQVQNWKTRTAGLKAAADTEAQRADDSRRTAATNAQIAASQASQASAEATRALRQKQMAEGAKPAAAAPLDRVRIKRTDGKTTPALYDKRSGKFLDLAGNQIDPATIADTDIPDSAAFPKDTPEALNRQQDADILAAAAEKLGKSVAQLTAAERAKARDDAARARAVATHVTINNHPSADVGRLANAVERNPNLFSELTGETKARVGEELDRRGKPVPTTLSGEAAKQANNAESLAGRLSELADYYKNQGNYRVAVAKLKMGAEPYFDKVLSDASDLLARLRTGAAITAFEEKTFRDLLVSAKSAIMNDREGQIKIIEGLIEQAKRYQDRIEGGGMERRDGQPRSASRKPGEKTLDLNEFFIEKK